MKNKEVFPSSVDILDQFNGICTECDNLHENEKVLYYRCPHVKYGILLQNPNARNAQDLRGYRGIQWNTNELIESWLKRRIRIFFKSFLESMMKFNLLSKNDYNFNFDDVFDQYCEHQATHEFYFFDAVKCRSNTSLLRVVNFQNCFNRFIQNEISSLSKLELLFVFSTRSWNIIRNNYSLDRMYRNDIEDANVTKAHGYLYKVTNSHKIFYIIPLVHMSFNGYGKSLRNSYFDYLEEGLRIFSNINSYNK